jgi:hypothetical protein
LTEFQSSEEHTLSNSNSSFLWIVQSAGTGRFPISFLPSHTLAEVALHVIQWNGGELCYFAIQIQNDFSCYCDNAHGATLSAILLYPELLPPSLENGKEKHIQPILCKDWARRILQNRLWMELESGKSK